MVTATYYQKAAMRTANPGCKVLSNAALGLAGEAGEVADIVKKHLYQGHDLDKEKVVKELGDCMWYIALMCDCIDVSLDDVMVENIKKLMDRYPDGFDSSKSINRATES